MFLTKYPQNVPICWNRHPLCSFVYSKKYLMEEQGIDKKMSNQTTNVCVRSLVKKSLILPLFPPCLLENLVVIQQKHVTVREPFHPIQCALDNDYSFA